MPLPVLEGIAKQTQQEDRADEQVSQRENRCTDCHSNNASA